MGERRGTKALELWCRRITEGYPGVNVQNMTTSWRDGLAFCAMIHHFRPDLIEFNSLNKDDVYANNELAFRTAEQHLGIPALLDAEDMASCSVPDRLSILTYLSQFYQTFGGSSPSRLAMNRTAETPNERIAPVSESPKQKVGSRLGMRRDPCAVCGLPVFLAEKLMVARTPYHRTCFRCARCNNQLTPGNYYETEEGQYCCETCPDEETSSSSSTRHRAFEQPPASSTTTTTTTTTTTSSSSSSDLAREDNASSNYQRPLSDEEKSEKRVEECPYVIPEKSLQGSSVPDLIAQTSQLRLNFMASHLLSERKEEISSVDGAEKLHLGSGNAVARSEERREDSAFLDDDESEEEGEEGKVGFSSDPRDLEEPAGHSRKDLVNTAVDVSLDTKEHEELRTTAISFHDVIKDKSVSLVGREGDTKDLLAEQRDGRNLSLVQKRLRMFEARQSSGRRLAEDPESRDNEAIGPSIDDSSLVPLTLEEEGSVREGSAKLEATKDDLYGAASKSLDESTYDGATTSGKFSPMIDTSGETVDTGQSSDSKDSFSITTAVGIDLSQEYPDDLNPFQSDDDDDEEEEDGPGIDKLAVGASQSKKVSLNPFETEEILPPKPAARTNVGNNKLEQRQLIPEMPTKRRLAAPQIYLNPFWSDDEDRDRDFEGRDKSTGSLPVPKPRTIKHTSESGATRSRTNLGRSSLLYASNSSIASSESATTTPGGTYRKKKPAPPPPNSHTAKELFASDRHASPVHKSYSNLQDATFPSTTPRARKAKPAPPPPVTSTPYNVIADTSLNLRESPISESQQSLWEDQKTNKDETNRNRQSLTNISCGENLGYKSYPDKSIQGKWKRKKGPAPPRPMPHRRKIKVMSMKDVKLELDEIEMQQQGLEKQGVRLEQLIRDKCESGSRIDDSCLGIDVEELVLELFALVNEKNELFRRQAELMLLRRQQRLEEEHSEVEYQIRCLMSQPEATKTDFEKHREEALIQRLIEIVERRNEIVECLEMDRRREVEEDRSIHKHMGLFAARNKNEISGYKDNDSNSSRTKKGKLKEKTKEKKSKKTPKKDADKDVDETEVKLKRHNKRKWF